MENPNNPTCFHSFLCLCFSLMLWAKGDQRVNPYQCEKWNSLETVCTQLELSRVPTGIPSTTLHLDLHGNSITRLQHEDFTTLVNLQYLDLRWNRIDYIENATFASLPNLKTLNMSGNRIPVSLLPQLVDFLPSLEHLELSVNWKWEEPVTLGNMTTFKGLANLTSLNLGGNDIVGVQDNSFDGLFKLQSLSLRDNFISHVNKEAFQPLKELQHLDLSNNYLSSDILQTDRLWSAVVKLTSLDLSENSLSSAPFTSAFQNFSLLHSLDLSRNELTTLTVDDFTPLFSTPLQILELQRNFITHIDKGLLASFANLKSLKLQSNPILFSELRDELPGLQFLEELTLGGSPDLDTITNETFPQLPSLKKLTMSLRYEWYPPFESTRLMQKSFLNLPNLTQLHLDNYFISMIESYTFTGLGYLERLELEENKLEDFPEHAFDGLPLVTHLGLAYNSLTTIKSHYFMGLKDLFWLNLQNNNILFIDRTAFKDLRSLKYLILTSNHITTVADLQGPPSLHYLDLGRNNFTFLSAGSFRTLGTIRHLTLAHNWISHIQKDAFSGMAELKRLDLADNRITNLTSWAFHGLSALEGIKLQHNIIMGLEPYAFYGLQMMTKLDLKEHSITTIPDDAFVGLHNLTELDLSANQIKTFEKKAFHGLDNVEVLNLQQNEIAVLDETIFNEVLDHVKTIDIQENHLFCNCKLLWFVLRANSQPHKVVGWSENSLKCAAPPQDQGKSLQILPFKCDPVFMPNLQLASIVSSVAIFFFMISIFCANYYTWKLRDLWFRLRNRDRVVQVHDAENRFVFDAFVAHHNDDKRWVERDVCRNLERSENHPNYRLCIHQRDFQAGVPIITNIRMAVDSSRKIVCVLTRNFLRSRWCQFEFQLAQHNMFEEGGGIRLILVFLEDIPRPLVCRYRHLQAVVDRDTYLEWPEDPRERPLFWRRLRVALGQPIQQQADDNESEADQHNFMALVEV